METGSNTWRVCSSCKKPINFSAKYYVCSVSTCNQKRTAWVFCAVECWDAHVPKMNHRESWAEERQSPTQAQWQKQLNEADNATAAAAKVAKAQAVPESSESSYDPRPSPVPAPKSQGARAGSPRTFIRKKF